MLILNQAIWLTLIIPLGIIMVLWPMPSRVLQVLRGLTLFLLVLAICQFSIKLPNRAGTVVVVADRSESMPEGSLSRQKEAVDLILKGMEARDRLAVVSFAESTFIERSPSDDVFGGFIGNLKPYHSNMNAGIEVGLNLIPPDQGGRIFVLTDGKWTNRDPLTAAARAAGRGISIDYRYLARPSVNEVAIEEFLVPGKVLPGQAYMLTAWVKAPVAQEIAYELFRGKTLIASGRKQVNSGTNRLLFRDRSGGVGTHQYSLKIKGAEEDPVVQNNVARALVTVEGQKPVLVVSEFGDQSGFVQLLKRSDVAVYGARPVDCNWSLEFLSNFSSVVLENVSANSIEKTGMETIASWVEETGAGLMMTGGKKSYGPGGYFKSPLDRIMPISMEMRKEHRKLSLAIAVVLDRSGSMAMPAGGGKTKIDLANIGTVEVLDLLSPMDELGVIAVDSEPHTMLPLDTVENNRTKRSNILRINSMGGGIFVYNGLLAGVQMLGKAKAHTKHIILFSDASDSEQPGEYKELLRRCAAANITVSVIGLGTEKDPDADFLKDIAKRGKGNVYFTASAEEIPRLFAQDTFTVARSTFIEDRTPVKLTAGFSSLGQRFHTAPPSLGGYNLCYLQDGANLSMLTLDEYKAPVVASWQVGSGRVLNYLGEADGKFSGPFGKWKDVGHFYSTLVRWTAGAGSKLPQGMYLRQNVDNGTCRVQLFLDPDRSSEPFTRMPFLKVLHGTAGNAPNVKRFDFEWKSADLLEINFPINGRETVLPSFQLPGEDAIAMNPVCLPYSPEFAPESTGRGRETLEKIADATGGKERSELAGIWKDLPATPQYIDLAPYLIVLALILFLLEILQRRMGLFRSKTTSPKMFSIDLKSKEKKGRAPKQMRKLIKNKEGPSSSRDSVDVENTSDAKPEEKQSSLIDAMQEARKKAKSRRR